MEVADFVIEDISGCSDRRIILNCDNCGCKCIIDFEVISFRVEVFCPHCGKKRR